MKQSKEMLEQQKSVSAKKLETIVEMIRTVTKKLEGIDFDSYFKLTRSNFKIFVIINIVKIGAVVICINLKVFEHLLMVSIIRKILRFYP